MGLSILGASSPNELDQLVSSITNDFLSPFKAALPSDTPKGPDAFYWGPDASCYFVMDNLRDEIALRFFGEQDPTASSLDIPLKIRDCLITVGLGAVADESANVSPFELSGGQQQRLVAALLIARPPQFVVGLNPLVYVERTHRPEIYKRILETFKKAGSVFLLAGEADVVKRALSVNTVMWDGCRFSTSDIHQRSNASNYLNNTSNNQVAGNVVDRETPALKLTNVSWQYSNGRQGVTVNSLEIYAGSFYAVCGPNAGGKSSLLRAMSSNYRITKNANIQFFGNRIRNPFKELVRPGTMAMAFQDANVHAFPGTVEEAIRGRLPEGLTADEYRLNDYLSEDLLAAPFWVKQAVSVIRALSVRPQILLLDEPMDGFGFELFGQVVQNQIRTLCRRGAAAVVVTHDPELVLGCATDYVWVENGAVDCSVSRELVINRKAKAPLLQWLGIS